MPSGALFSNELVRACCELNEPAAWREFVRRFQPIIGFVAMRTARRWGEKSPLVVEDLVQETFLRLCEDSCRLLREFEAQYSNSITGYVKVVTANVADDYFRRLSSRKRGGAATSREIPNKSVVDAQATERVERKALLGEIRRRISSLELGETGERDRRIFWLHYQAGMSARAIAGLPGIRLTTKGVESVIFRLVRLLRETMAEKGLVAIGADGNHDQAEHAETDKPADESTERLPAEKGIVSKRQFS